MTTITRTRSIDASPGDLWTILAALDEYASWESGYASAEYASDQVEGIGTTRRARLRSPIGVRRVTHVVTRWEPNAVIAWKATDTNFPFLAAAEQTLTLEPEGSLTVVENRIDYELKYGPLGRVADAMMMRRTVVGATEGFLTALAARAANAG